MSKVIRLVVPKCGGDLPLLESRVEVSIDLDSGCIQFPDFGIGYKELKKLLTEVKEAMLERNQNLFYLYHFRRDEYDTLKQREASQ